MVQQLKSLVSAHIGAVTALIVAGIAATVLIGCQVTTASLEKPGMEVTADQFNQEINRKQASLDDEANHLAAEYSTYQSHVAKYAADAKAAQIAIDTSEQESQRKIDQRQKIIAAIPGAVMSIGAQVATGHIDPLGLIGSLFATALPLVGVGATVDSVRSRLKIQNLTKPWDGQDRRTDPPATIALNTSAAAPASKAA